MYSLRDIKYYWQLKELFFNYECFYVTIDEEYGWCLSYLGGCDYLNEDFKFYNFHSLLEYLENLGIKLID